MRKFCKALARIIAEPFSLIPFRMRRGLIVGLLLIESRIGSPESGLRRLFALWDDLDLFINERATAYGNGANPKHRLTGYHDFFVDNIPAGSRVLDVGCGIGAVARSIANRVEGVLVTAVDLDKAVLERARGEETPVNLTFIHSDGVRDLADEHWDVIVLSNVLEHMEDRKELLADLLRRNTPKRVLIRVPLFERHWHLPLRKELGVNYFSDPTHHIEHTVDEFEAEMKDAGLIIVDRQTLWGEMWAYCRPA
ncbi:MAG: hypothetical protein A3G18_08800 [Rhodospirillales bacterium RIFCSPLOWO2_12_FULL_58_28]|nr:MAG: hypothetical protein A3H92_00355 [Rhodospirillales bacterium RIFCSPLOWO2_02_FULL_58_16]OHC79793.1 MAG: hypothetical protein A3G18_08800 [Rhodospirillales bacterium RIFCSPLOWO2_12_FULL_58_28]